MREDLFDVHRWAVGVFMTDSNRLNKRVDASWQVVESL
jgi:hypothetical protein